MTSSGVACVDSVEGHVATIGPSLPSSSERSGGLTTYPHTNGGTFTAWVEMHDVTGSPES